MTTSRRLLISSLYHAPANHALAASAYGAWSAVTDSIRGPLERKRKVSPAQLKRLAPELGSEFDTSRFMFAVETYLAVRATLVTHLAASTVLGARLDTVHAEVESARAWTFPAKLGIQEIAHGFDLDWAFDCFGNLPQNVVEAEVSTGRLTVDRFLAGPFFDVFQKDHRTLIPKELRHVTGTYYTPQWLARHVLGRVGYRAGEERFESLRIIDPTCGSGVFLVAAAEELRRGVLQGSITQVTAAEAISSCLFGVDIDPLAAVQSTANLTLALIALKGPRSDFPWVRPQVECRDALLDQPEALTTDLVVGNPPWVNWEYLPPEYRSAHSELWPRLAIFDLQGRDKAFSKEDISALFFAASVDNYLDDCGKIAFLTPQSLVKSALNHRGFRKFSLRDGNLDAVPIEVDLVEDFVAIRPFEGAANRTIMIRATRGAPTSFPVPYKRWSNVADRCRQETWTSWLEGEFVSEVGEPADLDDTTSHWTTGPESAIATLRQIAGKCAYRARTGVFTGGANGVYHLEVVGKAGQLIRVRNITERAKRVVESVEAEIESSYVYPFLRGRDVTQWRYETSVFILLPHTAQSRMNPVPERDLAVEAPATLDYLRKFRSVLDERAGFTGWERHVLESGFYACQRIGEYTFAPWKVVWRYIAPTFITAVIGPYDGDDEFSHRPVIPNEKLMSIACRSDNEAYFLCGILSGSFAVTFIESRMITTQIAPHLIQKLALPLFHETNPVHMELAKACRDGHRAAASGTGIEEFEDIVDALSADVFGASREDAIALRKLIRADGASSPLEP